MCRTVSGFLASIAIGSLLSISGCSKAPPPPAKTDSQSSMPAAAQDRKGAAIAAAMAELSDEDRTLAMAQKICPVGGGPLGTMGKPYEVTVKGRKVFLCCEHCKGEIESDPDKYLAKLDEQSKPAGDEPASSDAKPEAKPDSGGE